jgi:hypothetical protein
MSCGGWTENWLSRTNRAVKLLLSGHALWLVVAVWYLMVPAVAQGPKGVYQAALDAPLSKWKRQGQYDSLASCNQAKETFSQAMDSKVQLKNPNSVGNELSAYTAQCVTQDDPRFGKK